MPHDGPCKSATAVACTTHIMPLTANPTNRRLPLRAPDRCPSCNSLKIAPKGSRTKKLETVRLYRCRACGRNFTPGPRALRNKTYPLAEILEAMTAYNRGYSLEETSRRLSSRHGHTLSPATISRWLAAHPSLTTYRRLRAPGLKLFKPPQIIRTVKLYHRQVYEFAYHRAKLAFLRDGTLDDRRSGDARFAPLADFIEQVPHVCPHDLYQRDDGARGSQLAPGFLIQDRLTVVEKQNIATDTAALIIPSVGSNYDRHPKLQRFMLANDSTTFAVEVPIWLVEDDIAALEEMYGLTIVPRQEVRSANGRTSHKPRSITGHIDFLQARATARSISSIISRTHAPTNRLRN